TRLASRRGMTIPARALVIGVVFGCSHDSSSTSDAPSATGDAAGCQTSVTARPGTVLTTTGPVTGDLDGTVYAWKGIPYAAPPVGDLRWRPPVAAACWSEPRTATAFGAKCPQLDDSGQVVGDEDCLTLNVWAPADASGAPVLVFVHGG